MNNSFFIAGSMYLGWILSPEALVLASNYAGIGGISAILALLAGLFILSLWVILTKCQAKAMKYSPTILFIQISKDLATTSSLTIFLSTGMLVTAGFTFNETFLYWFPNFGFSAVLLAIILVIHLIGDKAVKLSQKVFISLSVLSLLTIIIAGLLSHSELSQKSFQITNFSITSTETISLLTGALLFYLGLFQPQNRQLNSRQTAYILAFGTLLLIFWQIVALKHVPQDKLAESTIPYILVGREILGQTGRILIGIAILSGTCAATNYFMSLATKSGSALIMGLSSFSQKGERIIKRILSLLVAAIIGICMASGLAGEPHLELYIYGALLLWLLSSGIQILIDTFPGWKTSTVRKTLSVATAALFFIAFLYLIRGHNETASLVIFITLALGLSSIVTLPILFKGKNYKPQPLQQGDVQ
jgi:hypothetical protein